MSDSQFPAGLRERKKLRTQRELAATALRLFAERGYDSVTVEEIADAVEVSPRTFFRYFPSKEDVLFADEPQLVAALREAIVGRPPGEPVLEAILNALLEVADVLADDPEHILLHAQIISHTPALRSRGLEQQAKMEAALAGVIAERLGLDIERDMAAKLVAAGTVAALRVALDYWLEHGGVDDLQTLLIDAMALLRRTFGEGTEGLTGEE